MKPPILVTGDGTHYVTCIEIGREYQPLAITVHTPCGQFSGPDWMRIDYFGTFMVVNCEVCLAAVESV